MAPPAAAAAALLLLALALALVSCAHPGAVQIGPRRSLSSSRAAGGAGADALPGGPAAAAAAAASASAGGRRALAGARADAQVAGGYVVTSRLPYIVAVQYGEPTRGVADSQGCGGVLISPYAALTAAHCINGAVYVEVGCLNYQTDAAVACRRVDVARATKHARWDGDPQRGGDLAILWLRAPLKLAAYAKIAARNPGAGSKALVFGWGATEGSKGGSAALRAAELTISGATWWDVAAEGKQKAYQWRTSPQFVMTAAGPDAGREACSGDSGGPLLVGGALVGLVSWGPGKYGCAGTWTAYTSVAYHRKWIAAAASWLPGPGRPVGGGDAMAVEIEDYGDYRDYDYDYEYA